MRRREIWLVCAGGLAGQALGAMVSVSGQVEFIDPPASLASGALTSLTTAYAFTERTGVAFGGVVDLLNPALGVTYGLNQAPDGVASAVVDSHIVHFDNYGLGMGTAVEATITFDAPIYAIIFDRAYLDGSDGALGLGSVFYPAGWGNRGFSAGDAVRLEAPDTLWFSLSNSGAMDQFRVLTLAPTPGAGVVLGMAGIMVGRRRRKV